MFYMYISNLDHIFSFSSHSLLVKAILTSLLKIVCLLVSIAYYTLAERKIMAASQRRQGPNTIGIFGLLQPIADGLKLLTKVIILPTASSTKIFLLAPVIILILSLISWAVIPFGVDGVSESNRMCGKFKTFNEEYYMLFPNLWDIAMKLQHNIDTDRIVDSQTFGEVLLPQYRGGWQDRTWTIWPHVESHNFLVQQWDAWSGVADINYGVLFVLAISSFNVYGLIIAGWASNSKYAFLGALRSAAQMISYEVAIGLSILPVALLAGSLNLTDIVVAQSLTGWYILPLFPCAIIFFISMFAETNRTPFDLTEAEAELVAGYNTEYSSIIFAMFFLAEYSNMLLMSILFVIFFLGGWYIPVLATFMTIAPSIIISVKAVIVCFLFVLVRATFPRYRYDQLMNICWKVFLPITLAFLIFLSWTLVYFNATPIILELVTNEINIQYDNDDNYFGWY